MNKIENDIEIDNEIEENIDDISETSSIADSEESDNEDVIQETPIKELDDEDLEVISDEDSDTEDIVTSAENISNELIDDELEILENDEDLDEEYYQKIDTKLRENIILNHHPELRVHNFEEIQTLCKVVRDENGKVVDPLHKTLPFITCYEKTRIIGERSKQINKGARHFVNVEAEITDGYLIALKEYEEKKIPFIIQRPLPNGQSEFWRFCDLECI